MSLLDDARRELKRCGTSEDACRQVAEKAWGHAAEVADEVLGVESHGADRHKERERLLQDLVLRSPDSERILETYENLKHRAPVSCNPETVAGFVRMAESFERDLRKAREVAG